MKQDFIGIFLIYVSWILYNFLVPLLKWNKSFIDIFPPYVFEVYITLRSEVSDWNVMCVTLYIVEMIEWWRIFNFILSLEVIEWWKIWWRICYFILYLEGIEWWRIHNIFPLFFQKFCYVEVKFLGLMLKREEKSR